MMNASDAAAMAAAKAAIAAKSAAYGLTPDTAEAIATRLRAQKDVFVKLSQAAQQAVARRDVLYSTFLQ